jgi:hypothetical protein
LIEEVGGARPALLAGRALKVASNARVYEALPPLAFLAFLRSANIRATDT